MAYSPMNSGGQTLTVDSTSGGVTLTVPSGAKKARCQVLTANIRFYTDGTAPTTTAGYQGLPGQWFELFGAEISLAKFIREGSTSGAVVAVYYTGESDPWDN